MKYLVIACLMLGFVVKLVVSFVMILGKTLSLFLVFLILLLLWLVVVVVVVVVGCCVCRCCCCCTVQEGDLDKT